MPSSMPTMPPNIIEDCPPSPEAAMPSRNSTVSDPSLSTASPTMTNSAEHSLFPSRMSLPTKRALAASAAPCDDIQMLCHASISTAMPSTMALKISWPMPLASDPITSVEAATTPEPTNPASSPATSQRLLPGILRVAAARIPMMMDASSTSRKTMMAVANMALSVCLIDLLGDDDALGGGFVKFSDERVTSWGKRADVNRGGAVSGNHFFPVQRIAVEFLRGSILILDQELDLRAGRNRELGRLELMVFNGQHIVGCVRGEWK